MCRTKKQGGQAFLFIAVLLLLAPVTLAHKESPESFSLEGTTMLAYSKKPLLPAVGDEVVFQLELIPRGEEPLEAEYDVKFHIYSDESFTDWEEGTEEKRIVVLGQYEGENTGEGFYSASHVFDTPGLYHVAVSVEHDGKVLSKEHHMTMIEPRSPGPLFWSWMIAVLLIVLFGVKLKIW